MIFGPELLPKVLDGTKTMTRRRAGTGFRYRKNRSYAVQPARAKKAVALISITDVREEYLTDISEEDARREGFADRDAFLNYWFRLYGAAPWVSCRVQVLSFELEAYLCAGGCEWHVAEPGMFCGECACEDDGNHGLQHRIHP